MFRQTHMEPNQAFRQVQAPVPSNVVDHGTSNTFSHAFILLLRLILLYIYMCVCLIFKKFQDLASPTPMDHHILSYYHILLYILSYMIIYDRIIYDHHFLPIFRVAIIEDIPDPLWQSFGMAVWSPSHWHTTDASLAGPLP